MRDSKRYGLVFAIAWLSMSLYGQHFIDVQPVKGDATLRLQAAIEQARNYQGEPVVIRLSNTDYHLSRANATSVLYYVSNTTSEAENPDQTKHVGLWLKGLKNVTIDGRGARLVTHGEITSLVIDSCENITLRNFMITAADPTVPELKVLKAGTSSVDVCIHPQSSYTIKNGQFTFVGDSWSLHNGIAQTYDPTRDITWRSWSPLTDLQRAEVLNGDTLRFHYNGRPQARPGWIFQMRDAIRDEACGLIQYSKNVTLEQIHFAFLGNFGLVGQMSENITYRHLTFEPEAGSGRTCAGFADFVQMSGCKGVIRIENSRFVGAHDDPINIHGTHLAVQEFVSPKQIRVRYMHPQTYGFQSFMVGDTVELIDAHTLRPVASATVNRAEMLEPREILVTLNETIDSQIRRMEELVVENVTYTPEVILRGNYFSRVPTRGMLVTTRRKVVVENNTFFRMQMSGILIADDARSWYESGMVKDVTIRNNRFIECGTPVILIAPENDRNAGCVHQNIEITNNYFRLSDGDAISAKSVDGMRITGNCFSVRKSIGQDDLIRTNACENMEIRDNQIEVQP